MNKEILFSKLKQEGVESEIISNLEKILTNCESGMFTAAVPGIDKNVLLLETKNVLDSIKPSAGSGHLL
jgi:hypothetical protein